MAGRPNKSTRILSTDTYQAKSQTKQTYRYTRMTSVELRLVFLHEDSNTQAQLSFANKKIKIKKQTQFYETEEYLPQTCVIISHSFGHKVSEVLTTWRISRRLLYLRVLLILFVFLYLFTQSWFIQHFGLYCAECQGDQ